MHWLYRLVNSLFSYLFVSTSYLRILPSTMYHCLKGHCHLIFCFRFFTWIIFPQASENYIRVISNFSKIHGDIRKILLGNSGAWGKLIHEKTWRWKFCGTAPLTAFRHCKTFVTNQSWPVKNALLIYINQEKHKPQLTSEKIEADIYFSSTVFKYNNLNSCRTCLQEYLSMPDDTYSYPRDTLIAYLFCYNFLNKGLDVSRVLLSVHRRSSHLRVADTCMK